MRFSAWPGGTWKPSIDALRTPCGAGRHLRPGVAEQISTAQPVVDRSSLCRMLKCLSGLLAACDTTVHYTRLAMESTWVLRFMDVDFCGVCRQFEAVQVLHQDDVFR